LKAGTKIIDGLATQFGMKVSGAKLNDDVH
jgi:hypothetical protein